MGPLRRTLGSALVAGALLLSSPALAAATTPKPPSTYVPAAIIVAGDGSNSRLWAKHPTSERKVASTIKMLNALVVRDKADLDEVVTVSSRAAAIDNGDVGLYAGQKLKVRQLLDMMLVCSANDAAAALAIHIGGNERNYVAMMNAKARKLGLTDTLATDPHGLYKHEHSSARDLQKLARTVMADSHLRSEVRKRSVRIPQRGGGYVTRSTTNRLLGTYDGITGVKTGFTNPAGYCFVASATRGNLTLYTVVLGADSVSDRFSESRKLLNWGFKNTRMRTVLSRETTYSVVPTGTPPLPNVVARPSRSVTKAMLWGSEPVKKRIVYPKPLTLPVTAGQQVAIMELRFGGVTFDRVPLIATASVSAPTPMTSLDATATARAR